MRSRFVAVAELTAGDSPRLSGVDPAIVQAMADVDPATLPAIVVERLTMRVFDGLHRLAAARLRGDSTILVQFVDGVDDAFVVAVRNNASHGRALPLGDRRAAAERIVRSHPHWSDRKVAEISNLSRRTVAKIRACSSGEVTQLNKRIGRDGREWPVRPADGRRRVAKILADRPDATLRELAAAAGVALGTAKAVRDRVRGGTASGPADIRPPRPVTAVGNHLSEQQILSVLTRDPSLIRRQSCRNFVQWLVVSAVRRESLDDLVRGIPPHLVGLVGQLVRTYADTWSELAERLDEANQPDGPERILAVR
ncbi:MAG TPA: hypothetical protein VGL06_16070 [Pseudonocardiaceae bacterium]|jgi:hypothetical protein